MRRMRVSAKNIKAAEDAAGNHNDDRDKQYRVKHGRAADLEAPSVLNNSRCTGSVRLNQQKGMSPMCSTSSVGCSRPLSGGGIRCAHLRYPFALRFLVRARAAPLGQRFRSGGAGAQLWGLFGASRSKPLAEGWLWRVCALAFQAG